MRKIRGQNHKSLKTKRIKSKITSFSFIENFIYLYIRVRESNYLFSILKYFML